MGCSWHGLDEEQPKAWLLASLMLLSPLHDSAWFLISEKPYCCCSNFIWKLWRIFFWQNGISRTYGQGRDSYYNGAGELQCNSSSAGAKPPRNNSMQREGEGVSAHWSPRCSWPQWWPGWVLKMCIFAQSAKGRLQYIQENYHSWS